MKTVGIYFSQSSSKSVDNETKTTQIEHLKNEYDKELNKEDINFIICDTLADVIEVLNRDDCYRLELGVCDKNWHESEEAEALNDPTKIPNIEEKHVSITFFPTSLEDTRKFFEDYKECSKIS